MEYSAPFDFKAELKEINTRAKTIVDVKERKRFVEQETKSLNEHNEMLKRMSKFVNAKNKNGQHPSGLR